MEVVTPFCDRLAETPMEKGIDHHGAYETAGIRGWQVRRYGCVASTQDIAAALPSWSAVVADVQSAGRGQWQRSFTSDAGGLYLTAVLPYDGDAVLWRGFALAVGWSVVAHFRARGIARVRLRWPNDLMIGDRKVGGILVTQGRPDTLCVGLGINVYNQPWSDDPSLEGIACRLADHADDRLIGFGHLLRTLLGALRLAYLSFSLRGLRGFAPTLNRIWDCNRPVRLELAAGAPAAEMRGRFVGILPNGDLILGHRDGSHTVVRSHWVKRLHER